MGYSSSSLAHRGVGWWWTVVVVVVWHWTRAATAQDAADVTTTTTTTLSQYSFADNFDRVTKKGKFVSTGRNGNDGHEKWTSKWRGKRGVSVTSNAGCASGYCLRLWAAFASPPKSNPRVSALRSVNLRRVQSQATLLLEYRLFVSFAAPQDEKDDGTTNNKTEVVGSVKIQVAPKRGSPFVTLETLWVPDSSEGGGGELFSDEHKMQKQGRYNIPSDCWTPNCQIRILVQGSVDFYVDNVIVAVDKEGQLSQSLDEEQDSDNDSNDNPTESTATTTTIVGTVEDDFEDDNAGMNGSSSGWNGNDGSLKWSSPWQASDGVSVAASPNCALQYCLQLETQPRPIASVFRTANLTLANALPQKEENQNVTVTLSFVYSSQNAVVAAVDISKHGKDRDEDYMLLTRLATSTSQPLRVEWPISSEYWTSEFTLQFRLGGLGRQTLHIDNVALMIATHSDGGDDGPSQEEKKQKKDKKEKKKEKKKKGKGKDEKANFMRPSLGCTTPSRGVVPGHRYVPLTTSLDEVRQYYLSVPLNYFPNASAPLPMIVAFHGTGWNGRDFRDYLRLEEEAPNDFIFVYPNGAYRFWDVWEKLDSGWMTGHTAPPRGDAENPDFVFFDDLVEDVSQSLCVDESRIYVTGHSWGGDMASSLPCSRAGRHIAAAVSVAPNHPHFFEGLVRYAQFFPPITAQDCQRPVPMMTMRGATDTFPSGRVSDWWFRINQCQTPSLDIGVKEEILTTDVYRDEGCLQDNVYVRYSNANPPDYRYKGNDHDIPVNYESLTLNFLLQHSLFSAEDIDGDGVPNDEDNCPNVTNSKQEDADLDYIGDACDPINEKEQDPFRSRACRLPPSNSPKRGRRTVKLQSRSGEKRKYYLSVPKDYNPEETHAVIVGFHGLNGSGKEMRNYLRLEEEENNNTTMSRFKAIYIYPNALERYWPPWNETTIGWNTGHVTPNPDFVFFEDLMADVGRTYCLDLSRVYVTGRGWGGDMASSLPCALGNEIAAAVSVSANRPQFLEGYEGYYDLFPPVDPSSDCQRPVPMMTMRGAEAIFPSGLVSDWWFQANQCQVSPIGPRKESIQLTGRWQDKGCHAANVYIRYSNNETRFTPPYEYQEDDSQIPVDYERVALEFFSQHSIPNPQDVDGDGIDNEQDNCRLMYNPSQKDSNNDGTGDSCEGDFDGDGVLDVADNCREVPNANQADDDLDGDGNACDDDRDGDGVSNAEDNCPTVANPNQHDGDLDGIGDSCDRVMFGDEISDLSKGCRGGGGSLDGPLRKLIRLGSSKRRFYLSLPDDYNPSVGHSLVFAFHDVNGTGKALRDYLRLEQDPSGGAIFVYPNALERHVAPLNQTAVQWYTGQTRGNDDFRLFDDILQHVGEEHCIDLSRVYVTGHGGGGDFAASLACARGNRIAAAVPVASGAPHYFDGAWYRHYDRYPPLSDLSLQCQGPVPIMVMGGIRDEQASPLAVSEWWYDINQCRQPRSPKDGIGRFADGDCQQPNIFVRYRNQPPYEYADNDHDIPENYQQETMDFFARFTLYS